MNHIVTLLTTIIFFFSYHHLQAQDLEVTGKAKIVTMDKVNTADSVVVRLGDGTLAVRDISTLSELQILSISNDTIYLTDGGFATLPEDNNAGWTMNGDTIGTLKYVLFGTNISGVGTKFFWDPSKGAIRAGAVNADQWEPENIGINSTAFGANNISKGIWSMTWGNFNKVSSSEGTAFGGGNVVNGIRATAFGGGNVVNGINGVAWGDNNFVGTATEATAFGGSNVATGAQSTAFGLENKAQSQFETVMGVFADTVAGAIPVGFFGTDQLFAVGNGTAADARNNAFTILKNGNVGIDVSQPTAKLEVAGDGVISGNLKVHDPVEAQDAATKSYVDMLEANIKDIIGVKDIDNNRYKTVTIGTQTWMAENLRVAHYNDGTPIPLVTVAAHWQDSSDVGNPAYTWYENGGSGAPEYGALYNWYAIDTLSNGNKNVCPMGWHVPSDGEWTILIDELDPVVVDPNAFGIQSLVSGGKMKETGLGHWNAPNTEATNESGFSGLPGSQRIEDGTFILSLGASGYWWSSTESIMSQGWNRSLHDSNGTVVRSSDSKGFGWSIRCLKDD